MPKRSEFIHSVHCFKLYDSVNILQTIFPQQFTTNRMWHDFLFYLIYFIVINIMFRRDQLSLLLLNIIIYGARVKVSRICLCRPYFIHIHKDAILFNPKVHVINNNVQIVLKNDAFDET